MNVTREEVVAEIRRVLVEPLEYGWRYRFDAMSRRVLASATTSASAEMLILLNKAYELVNAYGYCQISEAQFLLCMAALICDEEET